MQASARSVCWRDEAKRIRYPRPCCEAMNSPTTMPMIASVTATFMPLKMKGGGIGNRTRVRICHCDMRKERQSRSMVVSTDCSPVVVATKIGKNEIKIENVTREGVPIPSHTINNGAKAIFGINWKSTILGKSAWWASLECTIMPASAMPRGIEMPNASNVSYVVGMVCFKISQKFTTNCSSTIIGGGRMVGEMC